MMPVHAVWVYGPQGCGKTRHAQALAEYFGLSRIVEADEIEFEYESTHTDRVLFLSAMPPVEVPLGLVIYRFDVAMRLARLTEAS